MVTGRQQKLTCKDESDVPEEGTEPRNFWMLLT